MEREIKVRKKRFAAFWAVVLLICSVAVPTLAAATEVSEGNQTSFVVGQPVSPGAIITLESVDYANYGGTETIGDFAGSSGTITVAGYTDVFSDAPVGHSFQYWTVTQTYESGGVVTGVVLTPKFVINQYTISFDSAGGSSVESITADYGTAVTAPTDPTKTGHTFASWDKEIPSAMPAENLTITAQWTINQYTITFVTNGGSEVPSITADYTANVTAPADPTRDGYYFAGWDKEIPPAMPAENVTITAQWTPYVIDAGTYYLEQGKEYKLGNATKVSGDNSVYASGSVFYVAASGTYTFS